MKLRGAFVFLFVFVSCLVRGQSAELGLADVHDIMGEMLTFHIEHKEFSPLLAERSMNIFIQQFDTNKSYLLKSEVDAFLKSCKKRKSKVVKNCKSGDYSDFIELNALISSAIQRAVQIRKEVIRELVLSKPQEVSIGETFLEYPTSMDGLKERIKLKALRFFQEEKKYCQHQEMNPDLRSKIFSLYEKKLSRLENPYQDTRNEHHLCVHILRAFSKSLDAHSYFFSPAEAMQMRVGLVKEFQGVGVMLRETVDGVVVSGTVKGSPAEKCGKIAAGDFIAAIDGISTENLSYEEILERFKNNNGEVRLQIVRYYMNGKKESNQVNLKAEKISLVDERLQTKLEPFGKGVIAKLELPSFYDSPDGASAERDIKNALQEIQSKQTLLGVILDLRNNLGGFLNQAVKVAGLFMKSGVVVISKYAGGETKYLRSVDSHVYFDGPMIILTSKASASAAEIVALALQDYGKALIVGDKKTYGKGSIQFQNVTDPNARAHYKVTVGKYYTVSGRSAQIEGVKADIVVPTEYYCHHIGEEFLEYPLINDRVEPAYYDSLADVDAKSKGWFEKNYLPFLQKKQERWQLILSHLQKNSFFRQEHDQNHTLFREGVQNYAKAQEKNSPFGLSKKTNWGVEDLQMAEGVNILKDMIILDQ